MHKILIVLIFITWKTSAQNPTILKIAKATSMKDLKNNLYQLAGPEMEGRLTGSHGDTLASRFIAGWFKKNRLEAPYNKGTNYFQSIDLKKIVLLNEEITCNGKRYRQFDDWYVYLRYVSKTIDLEDLPVVFAGYGLTSDGYNDLGGVDVKGKIAIVMQAEPGDSLRELLSYSSNKSISSDYQKNLLEKGAAAVLVVTKDFDKTARSIRNAGSLYSYRSALNGPYALPRIYVSERMINELIKESNFSLQTIRDIIRRTRRPRSFEANMNIRIKLQIDSVQEHAPNVIGLIRGRDTSKDVVVMSAHHDHLGRRGDNIFYGAVDNASGSATLMEVAKLMQKAVEQGMRPKRTIIFASFTAEELGLLGSEYFASHAFYPVQKTWVSYNIDMVGRVDSIYSGKVADSNYVYYFYRDSLGRGLNNALLKANESVGLKLDDRYQQSEFSERRLKGSDHYPFYLKGIPVLRTDCGFAKDYHQPTDTPDKINYPLLTRQTQLAFLTLWNLANE